MSGTGDKPEWWVDGVGVGAGQGAEPGAPGPDDTPPHGTPATGAVAGSPAGRPAAAGTTGAPSGGIAAVAAPVAAPDVASAMAPAPTLPAPRQRGRWLIGLVALLLVVGILLVVFLVVLAKGPAYTVVTGSVQVASNDQVVVLFLVKNTGTAAGTPTCTVQVHLLGRTGTGSATVKEKKPVDPQKSRLYAAKVTVTNTIAHLVKYRDTTVTCT
jgi:hypothetical protein